MKVEFQTLQDLDIYAISTPPTPYALTPTLESKSQSHLIYTTYKTHKSIQLALHYSTYTTTTQTILYINKIDTSGSPKPPTFTKHLLRSIINLYKNVSVYVYCVTSDQYIFHNSNKNPLKHILTPLKLIKWYMKVLDPFNGSKYVYIPGEHMSFNGWQWGVGKSLESKARDMYVFEDDLVKKSLQYVDGDASVGELMSVMECMEMGSVRGLLNINVEPISDCAVGDLGKETDGSDPSAVGDLGKETDGSDPSAVGAIGKETDGSDLGKETDGSAVGDLGKESKETDGGKESKETDGSDLGKESKESKESKETDGGRIWLKFKRVEQKEFDEIYNLFLDNEWKNEDDISTSSSLILDKCNHIEPLTILHVISSTDSTIYSTTISSKENTNTTISSTDSNASRESKKENENKRIVNNIQSIVKKKLKRKV